MANYNWKNFEAKYDSVIREIAKANGAGDNPQVDMQTARNMLVYMAEDNEHFEYAGVPTNFDWDTCKTDVAEVRRK